MNEKKFFNIRNIIIILISIILIAASATGIVIYLNDRGEAEAATEYSQVERLPETGNNDQTEESVTPEEKNVTPGEENVTEEIETSDSEENNNVEATGGTTYSEEEITQEITETVVEVERKVYEDLELSWTTIELSSTSANMGIYKPKLQMEKTATEIIKSNNPDETIEINNNKNVPMVRPGDFIVYTIEVSNLGNYKATNINIKENLDVIFNGKEIDEGKSVAVLDALDAGKSIPLKVAYKVTQEDIEAEANIINTANVTNGNIEIEDYDDIVPVNPDVDDITGAKTWDDANNQDGKRPTSITINVLADGEKVQSKQVTAADNWKWTFTNLPKYAENGKEIKYTISEETVENYTTVINGYDITNTHVPETIDVSGSKTWDDAGNQDGKRPQSITINLLANGEKVESKEVKAKDGWKWTFEDLPKYSNGTEIAYTISEEAVVGYSANVTGYDVKNTHIPETIDVSGSKTWDDANNQDGKRPTSITINLLANGRKVDSKQVTAVDDWKWTFAGVPKYSNGTEITYTISEDTVTEYSANVSGYNITNTYVPETTAVTVKKVWEDENNQGGIRASSIEIQLYKNDIVYGNVVTLTVGTDGKWDEADLTYTWDNLPKYDNGAEIKYTVKEITEIPGYQAVYSEDTFTIKNIYKTATTTVTVDKEWGTPHVVKHPDIQIQLYKNDVAYGNVITLSSGIDGKWDETDLEYTWNNLPKYKLDNEGKLIIENGVVQLNEYTVEEVGIVQNTAIDGEETLDQYITINSDDTAPNNNQKTIKNTAKGLLEILSYQTQTQTYERPVDVVLVLDVSGSMDRDNTHGHTRAEDMVAAVNETITTINSHNTQTRISRVAVVTYSESAKTLLPLGTYTPKTPGQYLTYSENNGGITISTNVNGLTDDSVRVTGGTYIQSGIATGANILINANDPSQTQGTTTLTNRIPILILLSDGEPTRYTTNFANVGTANGGNGSTATNDEAYYTIRTAVSYKEKIREHYREAHMYTVGFGVDTLLLRTVLNPNSSNLEECRLSPWYSYTRTLYGNLNQLSNINYADGSYAGSMNSTELATLLNKFIHSSIPTKEFRIFTSAEIDAKRVYLYNVNATEGFSLSYGDTLYVELADAVTAGIVERVDNTANYYLKLDAIDTTEQIHVKYHQNSTTTP